ncbi:MAG: nicotinate phosphoribosyltransferase, partial [Bryobacteraceae bacterium]
TSAHSWVMSFPTELEAFRRLQSVLGESTVQLVDTYDTPEGVRHAAQAGRPLWGIRIDSGDFVALSREARHILDAAGLTDAKIMLSGDLDEYRIADLVASGVPVDSFGVGTQLSTSADAPSMGTVYKLVQIESHGEVRYTEKRSADKSTLPAAKQIYRFADYDVVGLASEPCPAGAEPLLKQVIGEGKLVRPLPSLQEARARAAAQSRSPRRVELSASLSALHAELAGAIH